MSGSQNFRTLVAAPLQAAGSKIGELIDLGGSETVHLPADLTIPESVQSILQPSLQEMKLQLVLRKEVQYGQSRKVVSQLVRDDDDGNKVVRFLIHIPSQLAVRPDGETLPEFTSLPAYFDQGQALYVMSEKQGALHRELRTTLEIMWPTMKRVTVKWIPWVDLQDLEVKLPDQRVPFLAEIFDIGATLTIAAGDFPPVTELLPFKKKLADFDEFKTYEARNNILDLLELQQYKPQKDEGPALAAAAVVAAFFKAERKRPHPMKSLIDYILQSNPDQEMARICNGLKTKYSLLS